MSSIAPIGTPGLLPQPPVGPVLTKAGLAAEGVTAAPSQGFGGLIDGLVGAVQARETAADQATRNVLLGHTGQLHQSVIAMQEASVAFSMMVEVRNKLVESYQELMRMQV